MSARLTVSLDFVDGGAALPVAQIGWDAERREAVAEWHPDMATSDLRLSPLLNKSQVGLLRSKARAYGEVHGVFGDSLPDGWGRLLIDRALATRGRALTAITDMDRLAMVGRHGMGALTYEPGESGFVSEAIDLDWFEGLAPEIGHDMAAQDLERMQALAGGSQGARPKFVALISADNTRLLDHRTPATETYRHVLIKRRSQRDAEGSVESEAAFRDLAHSAGVNMTPVAVLRASGGEPYFVTDRFDRGPQGRLHMQTVAALLDVDFRTAQIDYADLLKIVGAVTHDRRAVTQMFRRMVFNARMMNRDDHLKNHAFLMDRMGEWRLARAYDVSFSRGPGGEHTLPIAGEGKRPGRAHFMEVAKRVGIKPKAAAQVIDEVDAAVQNWTEVAESREVPKGLRDQIAEAVQTSATW